MKVYVASKADHAPVWREHRPVPAAAGIEIAASWIDWQGEADANLWTISVREAVTADALVASLDPGELHKGDLVEIGAHLGAGGTIYILGEHPKGHSWMNHPRVCLVGTIDDLICALTEQDTHAWDDDDVGDTEWTFCGGTGLNECDDAIQCGDPDCDGTVHVAGAATISRYGDGHLPCRLRVGTSTSVSGRLVGLVHRMRRAHHLRKGRDAR